MDPAAYDYYAGGAGDEATLRDNEAAWRRIRFRPRVLVDVSSVSTDVELLGTHLPSPVVLAPTAFQKLAHPEGEVAAVRGAGGHLYVASTLSTVSIEEICAAAAGPVWLQLYVFRDRELSRDLVQRAEAAGCTGLCLTVDVPVQGNRERDARNAFVLPPHLEMANFSGRGQAAMAPAGGAASGHANPAGSRSGLDDYIEAQFDAALDWSAVGWLASLTRLPLILKGIQHPEDGRRAVDAGARGVVVSNHGGRQLDGADATARILPEVVASVEGRLPVLVDGGIRRGSDVARALALGARGVLVGRPWLWGLAAAGARGVAHVVNTLDAQLARTLALLGARTPGELGPDHLAPLPGASYLPRR
jgi:4-hydroxymandelate oxidase